MTERATLHQVGGDVSIEEGLEFASFKSVEEMFEYLSVPGNQVVLRDPKKPTRYGIFEAKFTPYTPGRS